MRRKFGCFPVQEGFPMSPHASNLNLGFGSDTRLLKPIGARRSATSAAANRSTSAEAIGSRVREIVSPCRMGGEDDLDGPDLNVDRDLGPPG